MHLNVMENAPLVSIVVPNYNNIEYIRPFLESVLSQSYSNWELLIVDDGSTNESPNIINEYVIKDCRIHLFVRHRYPKGANTCRNIGIAKARGEYICFFDSDDLLPEYCIESRVYEMNRASKDISFIVFPAITCDAIPFDMNKLVLGFYPFKDDLSMFLKRYRLPFAVWTNIYRKEYLINNCLYWDEALKSLQDSDFNIMILSNGAHYEYSHDKRPNYFWRIGGNPHSITKTIKSIKNIDSQLVFYSKLLKSEMCMPYIKEIRRFGKTLLLRCLICGYPTIPSVLIDSKYSLFRMKLLRYFCRVGNIHNEYVKLFMFASCFPLCYIDELFFRIKNRCTMAKYFRKYC